MMRGGGERVQIICQVRVLDDDTIAPCAVSFPSRGRGKALHSILRDRYQILRILRWIEPLLTQQGGMCSKMQCI